MAEKKSLRVVIADDEAVIRMGLKAMVASLGHQVVGTAANGKDALAKTLALKPDLLLLDIKMSDQDGLAVAEALAVEMPLPVVMLTAYTEKALIERATRAAVMGYLVKPISESKLGPTIEVAMAHFESMQATAREASELRYRLETREVIDRAKRILTEGGLSESEAYLRMQSTARAKRCPMRRVAEIIIAINQRNTGKV